MSIATASFTQTATYYHVSPANGDAASSWIAGGPRKGTGNAQRYIGMILFDKSAISSAVANVSVPEARLTLHRDTAYGTDNVDISIAPMVDNSQPIASTHAESLEMAERQCHHYTSVSGDTSTIILPGYWLHMMKQGQFGGVMIYQEAGEASDSIARFTQEASLEVDLDAVWKKPVWMRPIGRGDVISDASHSLMADMDELMYYINLRMELDELDLISWDEPTEITNGLYMDWPAAVRRMQDAICDEPQTSASAYGHEQKDAVTWKRTGNIGVIHSDSNIILPNAEIINQLRNMMEVSPSGEMENLSVDRYGRAEFRLPFSGWKSSLNDMPVAWKKEAPNCGYDWDYENIAEETKVHIYRFGIWIFTDLIANKIIDSIKLRVTKSAGGTGNIKFYGVKVSAVPTTERSVNNVFDLGVDCGTVRMAAGETKTIVLSEAVKDLLVNGDLHGIGVGQDSWRSDFSASATLIINEDEE